MLPVDRIAAELIGCTKSALHRERPVAVEWPLLKMPRTLALQDDKCQVPAAAVIGLQNLTGWSQPQADDPGSPLEGEIRLLDE